MPCCARRSGRRRPARRRCPLISISSCRAVLRQDGGRRRPSRLAAVAGLQPRRVHRPADLARDLGDAFVHGGHRCFEQPLGRVLLGGAAAIDGVALARGADETGRDGVEPVAPFADRQRVAIAQRVVEGRVQAGHHQRPVVAVGGLQGAEQLAPLAFLERGQVGTAHRGAGDVHPRADLEPRDEHRRARPDHVDRDHVEPVAHGEMDRQRGALGQLDQERPRARADVEVAQEAVAQLEHRRGQHEALAVGQPEQETGAHQGGGDARDGRLGDTC